MLKDTRGDGGYRSEDDRIAQRLGLALRLQRKVVGKTIQQVAQEADLSVSFVSQVERGISAPSLTSFSKMARALETSMEALLEMPVTSSAVTRRGERTPYNLGDVTRSYEALGPGFIGAGLHASLNHMPAGHVSEIFSHEGEEFIYLLEGKVTYILDGVGYDLGPGDTIHFASNRDHSCAVDSGQDALELWVGTMPLYQR